MVQSSSSLKREERLLQNRQEYKKTRTDRVSGCRAKTSKTIEHSEAWKTPLLSRNFRHSDRFRKDDSELPTLRREKTFDDSLIASERGSESPRATHATRIKTIGEQLKTGKFSPLADTSKPLRKSLPSLLQKNNEEKDEFQAELKKATSRIRNELGDRVNVNETKTSQRGKFNVQKPNPTKVQSKVKESSLTNVVSKQETVLHSRRLVTKRTEIKKTSANLNTKAVNKYKFNNSNKENGRPMPDRGQASGKESTPEHSPTRKKEMAVLNVAQEK